MPDLTTVDGQKIILIGGGKKLGGGGKNPPGGGKKWCRAKKGRCKKKIAYESSIGGGKLTPGGGAALLNHINISIFNVACLLLVSDIILHNCKRSKYLLTPMNFFSCNVFDYFKLHSHVPLEQLQLQDNNSSSAGFIQCRDDQALQQLPRV